MIRLDMSEFMEEHTASRLIGSPPGFVGYDEGGQLTERVRSNPHSVILLDEIEKAHPKILDLFLQVFDEGMLTDSRGRRCSFRDAIILMTSNIGSGVRQGARRLGFRDNACDDHKDRARAAVLQEVRGKLRPELVNRLTEIAVFDVLGEEALREILRCQVEALSGRLKVQGVELDLDECAYDFLIRAGASADYGAREMGRTIEAHLARPLSADLLAGRIRPGAKVRVRAVDKVLEFDCRAGCDPRVGSAL